jgi:hypothetical protein
MRYDFGGDAGGTEVSMLILDHYEYSQNRTALHRYFPIVSLTLDFFRQHYNRTESGQLWIWPTQALEKYTCAQERGAAVGDPWFPPNATNCIEDDTPTVTALHVLLERVLRLPLAVSGATATQHAEWVEMKAALPKVPTFTTAGGVESVAPYGSYPTNFNATVNRNGYETPELFTVHPYRFYSLGRATLGGRSSAPALNCFTSVGDVPSFCADAQRDFGWTQTPMNAALLGLADVASRSVVGRALGGTAPGYRFLGFAPHEQE